MFVQSYNHKTLKPKIRRLAHSVSKKKEAYKSNWKKQIPIVEIYINMVVIHRAEL